MFGYIVVDRNQLSEEERSTYRGYYCGLCYLLGQEYGLPGRLALNYDMTFLYVLLASLYEPEQQELLLRCEVHPLKKQRRILSEMGKYCADMTVLLAYYNALDDWHDDKNYARRLYAMRLESKAQTVCRQYSRQSAAVIENIEKINTLEREAEINLDAVANCFGRLMGEIFVPEEQDVWALRLRALGENLGKFIYFMDAVEDAEKDARHKNYNPLLQLKEQPDYQQRCKEILTMFLGSAAESLEALPIVENLHILRNIMYAGVWSKYTSQKEKK